jgi:hypothetical protein
MTPPEEESDQLPEEQPGPAGGSQDTPGNENAENKKNEGGADNDGDEGSGQATGNPANAG